jgi:hypothetical protein
MQNEHMGPLAQNLRILRWWHLLCTRYCMTAQVTCLWSHGLAKGESYDEPQTLYKSSGSSCHQAFSIPQLNPTDTLALPMNSMQAQLIQSISWKDKECLVA